MLYADQRTLKGAAASLSWQPLDGDGVATDPGSVTVSVSRSDGTALVTDAATAGTGDNARTYSLAATHTAQLDRLTAVWKASGTTVATTYVDVVGGFIASIAQLLARYPGYDQAGTISTADLVAARNQVEDEFEACCGVAFVPRFTVDLLEGSGGDCLVLKRQELRSVTWATYRYEGTTTDTAFTSGALASIQRSGPGIAEFTDSTYWPCESSILVGYEHGYDRPPGDVVEAFLIRVHDVITRRNSSVAMRATQMVSDGVTTNLAVPGWGSNMTGIPDVDTVLKRYDRRVPGIA